MVASLILQETVVLHLNFEEEKVKLLKDGIKELHRLITFQIEQYCVSSILNFFTDECWTESSLDLLPRLWYDAN